MLTKEYWVRMGFIEEDIDCILANNEKYAHELEPIVREYIADLKPDAFRPYAEGGRDKANQKAIAFGKKVQEKLPDADGHVLRLIAWLNCVPHLEKIYKEAGLSEELFFESMKDFSYKVRECKNVYGVCGLYVDWFFLFFELKLFPVGRLQYEVDAFEYDEYTCGDLTLKKGDTVYSCHIPSTGKLTQELCMDSFQRAYEFFKPHLKGTVMPMVCHTWLFYKPYLERGVFAEGTNIERFARLFDIIDTNSCGSDFEDCGDVFHQEYEGTTEGLPADTSLRRNFIRYIDEGGDFGQGYGVLFYDGEKREVIQRTD